MHLGLVCDNKNRGKQYTILNNIVSFTCEIHNTDSTENDFFKSESPLLIGDSFIILFLIQRILLA